MTRLTIVAALAALIFAAAQPLPAAEEGPKEEKTAEKAKPEAPPVKAETPKDAVRNMAYFIQYGPAKSLIAQFHSPGKTDKKLLNAMRAQLDAFANFEKSFIKAYGKEKWETWQGPKGPQGDMFGEDFVEKLNVEIDGDKAVVKAPHTPEPLDLTKVDGTWKIEPGTMTPSEEEAEAAFKMMDATAGLLNKYAKKAGDVPPADLQQQMGMELMQTIMRLRAEAAQEQQEEGTGEAPGSEEGPAPEMPKKKGAPEKTPAK